MKGTFIKPNVENRKGVSESSTCRDAAGIVRRTNYSVRGGVLLINLSGAKYLDVRHCGDHRPAAQVTSPQLAGNFNWNYLLLTYLLQR